MKLQHSDNIYEVESGHVPDRRNLRSLVNTGLEIPRDYMYNWDKKYIFFVRGVCFCRIVQIRSWLKEKIG